MRCFIAIVLLTWTAASFGGPVTLKCVFTKGYHEKGALNEELVFHYVLDVDNDIYYALSNNGSNPVKMIPNESGLSLIEITGTGNVATTSIIFDDRPQMNAAHSRNMIFQKNLLASQYYGSCYPVGK